ncbi:MAG: mechanosensitive ion channel family protein [Candidatus Omnitrophica bacterium]|nr:mechanosensitive ion channel family protein [Candidatus Omnitrophota bacterium]
MQILSAQTGGETKIAPLPKIDLSAHFPVWMRRAIMNVAVWQFIAAFAFILLGLVLKKISDYIFEKKLIPLFKKTRIDLDNLFLEALSKPVGFLLLLGGLAGAMAVLPFPETPDINGFVFGAVKILVALDFLWFLFRIVDIAVKYLTRLAERTESKLDEQLVPLVSKAIKVTVGAISFLWIMQLLGYNISSLLAGLGIGGLAVALALQDTLSNFFGSVFIFLDRPFIIGDWVKTGDVEGIVEEVGFRSTRIRTWPKTLVTIPNKTVANATIDNLSKMPKRRVSQTIGVTYETTAGQMERAVSAIKEILMNEKRVDQEFMVVRFSDFGSSSLDISILYFSKEVAFDEHLEVKEKINLAIMRKLKEMGLSIAFPTMSLYLENLNKDAAGKKEDRKRIDENPLPF